MGYGGDRRQSPMSYAGRETSSASLAPVARLDALTDRCYVCSVWPARPSTTGGAPQMRGAVGSVVAGDDFEVFGVDGKCVVLVAVVVFGERNELVAE
jgi:hypothetical protein